MGRKPKNVTDSQWQPTMTAEEVEIRQAEAQVRLTEAKAEKEAICARQAQLDLDKACGQMVYLDSAMNEFNSKLGPIVSLFKNLPMTLATILNLSPNDHAIVQSECDKIAKELSDIEFNFETTAEVDARTAASHTSKKGKIDRAAVKSSAKKGK